MNREDGNDEFERQKLCYEQNSEHARGLNTQLNAIPTLAITITGGLWYAAATVDKFTSSTKFAIVVLAGLCNVVLIFAAQRIRDVFHSHLEKLKEFYPPSFPSGQPQEPAVPQLSHYSMITMYCGLMGVAAITSFIGAFYLFWPGAHRTIPAGCVGLITVMWSSWIFVTKGVQRAGAAFGLGVIFTLAVYGLMSHP